MILPYQTAVDITNHLRLECLRELHMNTPPDIWLSEGYDSVRAEKLSLESIAHTLDYLKYCF